MTTKSSTLLILALALLFLLPAVTHAQATPQAGTIWMKSNLTAKGDGVNALVDGLTTAADPNNPSSVSAFASTSSYYQGLGTVCNVYEAGNLSNPVWSSTNAAA